MKLKNKRSGEIKEFVLFDGKNELQGGATLKDLVKEWEDYEEPKDKGYWYIDDLCRIHYSSELLDEINDRPNNCMIRKLCGNYFDTREEAEAVVEKLKAWRRLKDKGFDFEYVEGYKNLCGNGFEIPLTATMPPEAYTDVEVSKDLDLLFSQEYESRFTRYM